VTLPPILRRLLDFFPWTPLGLLTAGGSAATLYVYAFQKLDLILLVVGYAGAALPAVSALAVAVTALALKLGTKPDPAEPARPTGPLLLETRTAFPTDFSLPSLWFAPLVQLSWTWEEPAGPRVDIARAHGRLLESVRMHERGLYRAVRRRILLEDVLGLSRVAIRLRETPELDVLPHPGALRHIPALTSMAGGDDLPHPLGVDEGDRLELRRYVPGDPARFIHWKVLGRTGELMTRTPERALTLTHRAAAFIIAGDDDDATAAVARVALERGLLGPDFRFGSDADPAGASDLGESLKILMRSTSARTTAGANLRAFLEEVEKKGPASLVLFAPPAPGDWLDAVAGLARIRRLTVLIGVDGVVVDERRPLWRRLLSVEQRAGGTRAGPLGEVLRFLAENRNCRVSVVDRPTGRPLSDRHLSGTGAR
jgi:hypothetical protein